MNGQNLQLAASIVLDLLAQAGPAIAAISAAKAENRDLTDDELGTLFDAETVAAAKLAAA